MSRNQYYDYIEHQAIVEKVEPEIGRITVRIDDSDECGDCPAAKFCGGDGQPSNKITIETPRAAEFHKDDIVTVRGTERMHRKAIMYATVFPCIILVAMMVGIYLLTNNQLAAALSGIGVTILFYLILWLCRDKIAHEFVFTLSDDIERHR